ncbi:MAG: hypothetical protein WCF85_19365 [Rhodospirillaceae bacterium]
MSDAEKRTAIETNAADAQTAAGRCFSDSGPTSAAACGKEMKAAAPNEVDALNFSIEKSMRYHQRRRAHFDTTHRLLMLISLLAGSAAFASTGVMSAQYFGLLGAVVGALNLVWAFSHRARDHEILFRRFSELAVELRSAPSPAESDMRRWIGRRIAIEADEPAVYWAVEADCWNEVSVAWGREKHGLVKISRACGLLKHLWRFESSEFPIAPPRVAH